MLYGKITGTYSLVFGDGNDADPYPDAIPASGSVTFTPSVTHIINATEKRIISPRPITCNLGADGEILDPNGQLGVYLIATDDPQNNPTNWTYRVEVKLDGIQSSQRYDIRVPGGSETDLSAATPVAGSTGNAVVKGDKGEKGDAGADGTAATNAHAAKASGAHAATAISYGGGTSLPASSVEAALDALDGRTRYGTGNPEGSVTAPPGVVFINTEAGGYSGVTRWEKASGTGNTGWRVLAGDTGWRKIAATGPNFTGGLLVRRVNSFVEILNSGGGDAGITAAIANGAVILSLPTGFRPKGETFGAWAMNPSRPTRLLAVSPSSGNISAWDAGTDTSGTLRLQALTYSTPDAWPTTLPGSAA